MPKGVYPHTEEHNRRVAESRIGKHHSPETLLKLSLLKQGSKHPNFGKHLSEETRRKISEANKGYKHTPETRKKMSQSHIGKQTRENNNNWNGGISFEPYCFKFNSRFKERVRTFFNRKCVVCNSDESKEKLHVHHVWYNKETCCDNSKPLFVALCHDCHSKTNGSKKNREYWGNFFTELINTKYGGKCYDKPAE